MVNFREVSFEDKNWITAAVMAENARSTLNFGNLILWGGLYWNNICRFGDSLIIRSDYGNRPSFSFPAGCDDLKAAIAAIDEYSRSLGYSLKLFGLTEAQRARLEAELPGRFEYTESRDSSDYIYRVDKLSSYSGKALHGKKNHCNYFEANHSWEFRELSRELIPVCLDMLGEWEKANADRLEESIVYEHEAIMKTFDRYEELGFFGGVLFAEGMPVGFSVGELAGADCVDVHFEKARHDMRGAYPMVCREFARLVRAKFPAVEYLNREEDMGLEPLRQSKLSYKPEFLLTKFSARWKDE